MPLSNVLEAESFLREEIQIATRPRPDSFDSAHECSVGHLLEVYRLVETADHDLDGYVFDDSCLHVA